MKGLIASLLLIATPALGQPADEERGRLFDEPALRVGSGMLVAGYAGTVIWAAQSDEEDGLLNVPLVGPWLELFTLPDCPDGGVFCDHGTAKRVFLVADGAVQATGVYLVARALVDREDRDRTRVRVAPLASGGIRGLVVSGRF
jgi:hypothetical protein